MKTERNIYMYSLLVLVTLGYCWIVRLGAVTFSIMTMEFELPLLTRIIVSNVRVCQVLLLVSLIINILWAVRQSRKDVTIDWHLRAVLNHTLFLLLCIVLHVGGMLVPLVIKIPVLK